MIYMDEKDEAEFSDILDSLPYSFEVKEKAFQIKGHYAEYEGREVSLAGRATGVRSSGKLVFVDIMDASGKIQLYFDSGKLDKMSFDGAKALNMGDLVGASGTVFKTKPGEISINVSGFKLLSKAMRTLPDKWKGLTDIETRYRKRYLDLIVNPAVREIFTKRVRALQLVREFMVARDFLEFETPVIQPLYGGADAEPFRTFVNTLGEEDYLRIADELYLKRLIIGGFERVFEIYKAFRNEDIDSIHSPEFTMMEAYEAYTDYNGMMELCEHLLESLAVGICGSAELEYQGKKISLRAPFRRIRYVESINEAVGADVLALDDGQLFTLAEKHGIRFEKGKRGRAHAYEKLFEILIQPKLVQPTFAVDFPAETSPLTRRKRSDNTLAERFELFVDGIELANAYSELNNPIIQRKNFEAEQRKAEQGDKEAEPLDMDFIEAMEYGMPPTGGIGIGLDRLVMFLTNQSSIKEVIAFPMERRGVK